MEYVFYFDESFHDKKVTVNSDGKLNILADDKLDSYVGFFWGCRIEDLVENEKMIFEFEKKQRERFRLEKDKELKSTTISKSSFEYGIASFSRDAFRFYKDLFSMIDEIDPIIQVEIISKMEFFVRTIVAKAKFQVKDFDESVFIYTLTKFLITYGTDDVFKAMVNIHDRVTSKKLTYKLLHSLDKVLKNTSRIKRKEREYPALLQLRSVIMGMTIKTSSESRIDFSYTPNFVGLSKLLNELNIDPKDIGLIIDNEDKTYQEAKKYPFNEVKITDSKNCIEVRLSDFISGFIGRMLYALEYDPRTCEDSVTDINALNENDLETKRLLSPDWFRLTKEQFYLYRLICKTLIEKQKHFWSYMTTCYADQICSFITLISYFDQYSSYEEYLKTEPEMHAEHHSAMNCDMLEDYFRKSLSVR